MSGPLNNTNAQHGDEPKESFLHIRIDRRRKAAYVRAARPGPLAPWAIKHLDGAAGYKDKVKP
mgnify:FL=1